MGSQNFSVIGVTKFYGGYDSKKVYGVAKNWGWGWKMFWGSGTKKCKGVGWQQFWWGAGVATFYGGYGKIMLGGKKVLRVGWGGKIGGGAAKKIGVANIQE